MNTVREIDPKYLGRRGSAALWYGLLGAPFSFAIELLIIYAAVPFDCARASRIDVSIIGAISLAVSLSAGFVSYRIWRELGQDLPRQEDTRVDRTRLLAVIGLMFSGLFSLLLLGHLLAIAMVGCPTYHWLNG